MLGHIPKLGKPSKADLLPDKLRTLVELWTVGKDDENTTEPTTDSEAKNSTGWLDGDDHFAISMASVAELSEPDKTPISINSTLTDHLETMMTEDGSETQCVQDDADDVQVQYVKGCPCPKCRAAEIPSVSLISEDEQAPKTPTKDLDGELSDSSEIARAAPAGPAGRGAQKIWDATSNTKNFGNKNKRKDVDGKVPKDMFNELSPNSRKQAVVRFFARRRLTSKSKPKPAVSDESLSENPTSVAKKPAAIVAEPKPKAKSKVSGNAKAKSKGAGKAKPVPKAKPKAEGANKFARLAPKLDIGKTDTDKEGADPKPPPSSSDSNQIHKPVQMVNRSPQNSRVGEAYLLQAKHESESRYLSNHRNVFSALHLTRVMSLARCAHMGSGDGGMPPPLRSRARTPYHNP